MVMEVDVIFVHCNIYSILAKNNYKIERERDKERNGNPKSNVVTSGSPVANPKSGPGTMELYNWNYATSRKVAGSRPDEVNF
jgi:hypothetical protein